VVQQSRDRAYIVNPCNGAERPAPIMGNVERVIESRPPFAKKEAKSLRLRQRPRNLLIFVPLLAARKLLPPELAFSALLAFFTFDLCASSVYLLNNLLDLEDDLHHPVERKRALASDALPLTWELAQSPSC
jgi:4-hydroxybenzoate polyprenyltransferase